MKRLHVDCFPIIAGLITGTLFLCFYVLPMIRTVTETTPEIVNVIGLVDEAGAFRANIDVTTLSHVRTSSAGIVHTERKYPEGSFILKPFQNYPNANRADRFNYAVNDTLANLERRRPVHERRVLVVVADGENDASALKPADWVAARLTKDDVSLYFVQLLDGSPQTKDGAGSQSRVLMATDQASFDNALEQIYKAELKEAEAESKTHQAFAAFTVILTAAFLLLFLLGFLCCWGFVKCRSRTIASR